jgi:hypothetical protein
MKQIVLMAIAGLFICASCKKDYSCECRNSFGTYDAGTVNGTKNKAEDKCKALSTSETNCYVK